MYESPTKRGYIKFNVSDKEQNEILKNRQVRKMFKSSFYIKDDHIFIEHIPTLYYYIILLLTYPFIFLIRGSIEYYTYYDIDIIYENKEKHSTYNRLLEIRNKMKYKTTYDIGNILHPVSKNERIEKKCDYCIEGNITIKHNNKSIICPYCLGNKTNLFIQPLKFIYKENEISKVKSIEIVITDVTKEKYTLESVNNKPCETYIKDYLFKTADEAIEFCKLKNKGI